MAAFLLRWHCLFFPWGYCKVLLHNSLLNGGVFISVYLQYEALLKSLGFVGQLPLPSLWKRCTHSCRWGDTVRRGAWQGLPVCRLERGEARHLWRTPAGGRPPFSNLSSPVYRGQQIGFNQIILLFGYYVYTKLWILGKSLDPVCVNRKIDTYYFPQAWQALIQKHVKQCNKSVFCHRLSRGHYQEKTTGNSEVSIQHSADTCITIKKLNISTTEERGFLILCSLLGLCKHTSELWMPPWEASLKGNDGRKRTSAVWEGWGISCSWGHVIKMKQLRCEEMKVFNFCTGHTYSSYFTVFVIHFLNSWMRILSFYAASSNLWTSNLLFMTDLNFSFIQVVTTGKHSVIVPAITCIYSVIKIWQTFMFISYMTCLWCLLNWHVLFLSITVLTLPSKLLVLRSGRVSSQYQHVEPNRDLNASYIMYFQGWLPRWAAWADSHNEKHLFMLMPLANFEA